MNSNRLAISPSVLFIICFCSFTCINAICYAALDHYNSVYAPYLNPTPATYHICPCTPCFRSDKALIVCIYLLTHGSLVNKPQDKAVCAARQDLTPNLQYKRPNNTVAAPKPAPNPSASTIRSNNDNPILQHPQPTSQKQQNSLLRYNYYSSLLVISQAKLETYNQRSYGTPEKQQAPATTIQQRLRGYGSEETAKKMYLYD